MARIGAREFRIRLKDFLFDVYKNETVTYIHNHETEMGALVPVKYAKMIEKLIAKETVNEKISPLQTI